MEELERKCIICGHVFTLESRGRKKKRAQPVGNGYCKNTINTKQNLTAAKSRRQISVSSVASR